jgi:hypothetical protein
MAYDVSATPLRRIFPHFLAMIVQFYRADICANCCCGDRRPSSAEENSLHGWGMGRWRRAGLSPAWCSHLALSVRCLQDFRGHHGAMKCCKLPGVCTGAANIVRALRDNFTMYVLQSCHACTILGASCVHLAMPARLKSYRACILQHMHDVAAPVRRLCRHCRVMAGYLGHI